MHQDALGAGDREGRSARRRAAHAAPHDRINRNFDWQAMALTGAILGHSNPRSTAICAHIQHEPSRKAANRVSRMIATALLPSATSANSLTRSNKSYFTRLQLGGTTKT